LPPPAGGEPLHPEAGPRAAEEAVADRQGEAATAGRAQQGHPGAQQAGEPVSRAAETQQDTEGRLPAPLARLLLLLLLVMFAFKLTTCETENQYWSFLSSHDIE